MELLVLLILNSFPPALFLGSLALTYKKFSLLARISLGVGVVIVSDVLLSVITFQALKGVGLFPVQHSVGAIQQYFVGEYLARTVMYWIVGFTWVVHAYRGKNKQFAIGLAIAICIWELIFFFLEFPGNFRFGSRLFWIYAHLSFYVGVAFICRPKISFHRKRIRFQN